MTNYTLPPYPKVFIYWGTGAIYADRVDTMVMFHKNFYLYDQWTTFSYLDANLNRGDCIYFPGGNAAQIAVDLQTANSMTAAQVRAKIQSYIDNYMHIVGVSAGALLASDPYPSYDYFGIFDYSGDRDGTGNNGRVELLITPAALYPDGDLDLVFNNGPVFYQALPPDYDIIAAYDALTTGTWTGTNNANIVGSPAVLYRQGGSEEGAVLLIGVKFEKGNAPKTAYKQFFKIFEEYIVSKNII
jgi:hypothetical protein